MAGMAKRTASAQQNWTTQEVRQLRSLAKQKMPAARIARTLDRSLDSTKHKASRLGLSLGAREPWTADDVKRLRALAKQRKPVPAIAKALKRTVFAVERAASIHRVSLDFRD
jgi:hypothetical protein